MIRALLFRLLLAVALTVPSVVEDVQASCNFDTYCPPPPPTPGPPPPSHHDNTVYYIIGGIVVAFIGLIIGKNILSPPPPTDTGPITVNLPPSLPPPGGGGGGGGGGLSGPGVLTLRNGFNLPPPGAPIVIDEILLDIPTTVSDEILREIAARNFMTQLETVIIKLTGRRLHRWHLDGGGTVTAMLQTLSQMEPLVAGGQGILLYYPTQAGVPVQNSDQYAPEKLNLTSAHRLATGERISVAVIDSGVDASHPDLAGAIAGNFDAAEGDTAPHPHGTGMAGAIAARRTLLGTAPRVRLFTVRAFSTKATTVEGTTFNILKGLDWAVDQGVRIINMSFAGPPDPRLREALLRASRKGIVLVASAGNAGPRSPPAYPAADPGVIAVTATDVEDALFPGANRGSYIAVAAPGVDVLVPGPEGTYQLTTGTSVAAAEVSGIVALMLERNPSLTPADVKRILIRTAKPIGPKGRERDFGSGLVNALSAVQAARPR